MVEIEEPTLTWERPMSSAQAAHYLLTAGFVAVELWRVQNKAIFALEREKQELAEKVMELETIASVRETSSQKKVIFLRKRLEPIERVWKTGEDYMLYDAVKECMEMKEGG